MKAILTIFPAPGNCLSCPLSRIDSPGMYPSICVGNNDRTIRLKQTNIIKQRAAWCPLEIVEDDNA